MRKLGVNHLARRMQAGREAHITRWTRYVAIHHTWNFIIQPYAKSMGRNRNS
jgi:hypothetical protein